LRITRSDLEEQVLIDQQKKDQERKKTAAVSKSRRSTYFAARYSKKKKDHQMDAHNSSGKRKADGEPMHDDGNGMATTLSLLSRHLWDRRLGILLAVLRRPSSCKAP
jgi:hypothetical protein